MRALVVLVVLLASFMPTLADIDTLHTGVVVDPGEMRAIAEIARIETDLLVYTNRSLDDVIMLLAMRGRICEVLGHKWSYEPACVDSVRSVGRGYVGSEKCNLCRRCVICGEIQERRMTGWE